MKCLFAISISMFITLGSCRQKSADNSTDDWKKQVTDAEHSFAVMAVEKGIAAAFEFYADTNAVIKRGNDSLIFGKEGIRDFYSADYYRTTSLQWEPDFVEVAASGDLAYTYGRYVLQSKDSTGKISEKTGVFHTVWKKQADGSWKYVWD
jgi:ketosteroid isomerase-like protein